MRGHFSLMALSRGLTRLATVASILLSSISRADHEVHDIADITKMQIIIKRNIRLLTEIDKLIFKKSHLVKL